MQVVDANHGELERLLITVIERRMHTPWFGEFMGTLVLILLGDGVVAAVLLKKSKAENSGWIVITAGWAFAVMCGIFTAVACGSPGAHLNPAVTLGVALKFHAIGSVRSGATCVKSVGVRYSTAW